MAKRDRAAHRRRRRGLRPRGHRRLSRSGVRLGAAVPAVALGVDLDRPPQREPVDVGPQDVGEHHLGVRRLPEHEVREPLLARRAPDQVGVRELGDVEVLGEGLLVDLVGVQPAGRDLPGDRPGRVGQLGAAAVVDAHRQRQHVVVPGQLLGDLELLDHRAPQPGRPAGPADPDAELVHLVAPAADHVAVEAHQEPHLVGRAGPVLGGEGVGRDRLHADLDGALDHVEQRGLALLVAGRAGQARAAWPSGRCRP